MSNQEKRIDSDSKSALIQSFQDFDKWRTYEIARQLLDSGKVSKMDIYDAAFYAGIIPSVVDMRLDYLSNLDEENSDA